MTAPTDWRTQVKNVVDPLDVREQERRYDEWAETYDADHLFFGNALLVHYVGMFCRHVPISASPILDAGAGTGRLAQTLSLHGYKSFTGIDLSAQMLRVAASKGVYERVEQMRLGEPLDFADDSFAVVGSIAALSPGHAGADCFDELIRITRPDGMLVLAMRADCESQTGFMQRRAALEASRQWVLVDEIPRFLSHPELDPPLYYGIHVYRIPI